MKAFLKKNILKVFDPIASRLGYRKKETIIHQPVIDSYNKSNLLHTFFFTLKLIPFVPKHIIDVGANHGGWTREALKEFPGCRFTLLEPQAQMKNSIQDILEANPKVSFNAVGAGSKSGSFKFTIAERDDSCSFMYSDEEAMEKGLKQIEVPVVTLNEFIRDQNLPVPDVIKIDAEGLDLEVLEGANDFFGRTEVFLVEAGIVNKHFSNSIKNVINYMDKNEYRLFDITDINRPFDSPVLWLVELAFVKKGGVIDSYKWVN